MFNPSRKGFICRNQQHRRFRQNKKNALLDQFKTIVDAGELTIRSDSDDMRSDSDDIRWDSAIDRIAIKYGLHLDDWKRLGPNQMGKPCGRGWVGLRGACRRGKKSDDNTAKIKESKAALADRIRARKGLSTIRSRDGKNSNGEWDIGSAHAPGKELQSTVMAKRTSPAKTKMSPNPDRAARMMTKESERARINWGRSTGDWKQKPDSTAMMDMVQPTPIVTDQRKGKKAQPTVDGMPIKVGQKVWDTNLNDSSSPENATPKEKTVVGWSRDGKTVTLRRSDLNEEQKQMVQDRGKPGLFDRKYHVSALKLTKAAAMEAVSEAKDSSKKYAEDLYARKTASLNQEIESRKKTEPTPIESGRSLKSLFAEADRIGSKYQDKPMTLAERREAKQEADKMLRETGVTETMARAVGASSISTARKAREARGSAGDKIRAIADKVRSEQNIQKVATGRVIQAAGKIWQNQENLISEVAKIANSDLDSAERFAKLSPDEQRREVDKARSKARAENPATTPTTLDERRSAKQGSDRILKETSKAGMIGPAATRKMNTELPRSKSGNRIRAIADKMRSEGDIQKVATGRIIQAAGKIWQNHENLISEVATLANSDLDRAARFARLSPAEQRREMDNAPVSIANSRKSSEPRKRGRSVD